MVKVAHSFVYVVVERIEDALSLSLSLWAVHHLCIPWVGRTVLILVELLLYIFIQNWLLLLSCACSSCSIELPYLDQRLFIRDQFFCHLLVAFEKGHALVNSLIGRTFVKSGYLDIHFIDSIDVDLLNFIFFFRFFNHSLLPRGLALCFLDLVMTLCSFFALIIEDIFIEWLILFIFDQRAAFILVLWWWYDMALWIPLVQVSLRLILFFIKWKLNFAFDLAGAIYATVIALSQRRCLLELYLAWMLDFSFHQVSVLKGCFHFRLQALASSSWWHEAVHLLCLVLILLLWDISKLLPLVGGEASLDISSLLRHVLVLIRLLMLWEDIGVLVFVTSSLVLVFAFFELLETQDWISCICIQLILDCKQVVILVAHIAHIWRSKKLTEIQVQEFLSLEIDGPYLRVQTRVQMQSSLGVSGWRERRKDVLFHALLAVDSNSFTFNRRYF